MEENKVSLVSIIIAATVLVGGLIVGWYFYSKREAPKPQPGFQTPTIISPVLTKNQIDNLIKSMSTSATATPTLSKTQLEKLSKSLSASKTAQPVLGLEEQRKLIEAMSVK